MKLLQISLIVAFITLLGSCRKDFETVKNTSKLTFSSDTIFLDTLFSNISSSTRRFKVYNKTNDNITIPTIELARGDDSRFRLNVDGVPGNYFTDVDIKAKDSIFIFVEGTVSNASSDDLIYTDSIVFDKSNNFQDVDLIALVRDAHFLYPKRDANLVKESIILGVDEDGNNLGVEGFLLDKNTTFTSEKPYVIYGFVGVPKDKTLTIEAGAKIHFHSNSGILVQSGGTLKVNGTLENKVVFQGDRLEPNFAETAGQWGTIWLREGSRNNEINHAVIKNGVIGLLVDSYTNTQPTLTIKNTELYNFTNYNILGRNSNIKGENLVLSNSGQSLLACTVGGMYSFNHCTFANYWVNSNNRQLPAVLINNFYTTIEDNKEIANPVDLKQANFVNCIIDGNQNIEFILDKVEGASFTFNVANSMLKFRTSNQDVKDLPEFDFEDINKYQKIILNGNANFRDIDENDLIIGKDSDAIGKAVKEIGSNLVPFDILGVDRTVAPDIGAYQHIDFEAPIESSPKK